MASTPSASALSAVLRCQGNILARKQANKKRPPAAVYGLGMTCGDSVKSAFRSLWGFIFHRERVEIPGVLSVAVRFETGCSGKSSIRNVSDSVQKQLGIGWNQLHPDCDKLSGCVRCTSEHHEDQPKTLEGAEPGE
ncbi:hypothetical protein G5714_015302 [Onychostoma macrolepis]|uniref:Uncharacterized protein n=1 Tax=Onychostoma macrolepis TaxID=369639 RepID=A0A7J6CCG2_9TELE|nr:hypothetical protein G5714_015302 [Onychostoma macrolepis]